MVVDGFNPDMIVGISRGGLVPARIMSDILGIREIAILGMVFYTGVGEKKDKPLITQELTQDINGKNVLLVDDVSDSGKSFDAAKKYLLEKGAKEVKTAAIHFKPGSIHEPDYYHETTRSWIVYPWEEKEMERELKNSS